MPDVIAGYPEFGATAAAETGEGAAARERERGEDGDVEAGHDLVYGEKREARSRSSRPSAAGASGGICFLVSRSRSLDFGGYAACAQDEDYVNLPSAQS
jgi:hypothetical protein